MVGKFEEIKQLVTESITHWTEMSSDEKRLKLEEGLEEIRKYSNLFNLNVINHVIKSGFEELVTGETKTGLDLTHISKVMKDAQISQELAETTKKSLLDFQNVIKNNSSQLVRTAGNVLISQLNSMLTHYEEYSPKTQQAIQNVVKTCGEMGEKGDIAEEDINKLLENCNTLANAPEVDSSLLLQALVGLTLGVVVTVFVPSLFLLVPLTLLAVLVVDKVLSVEPEQTLGASEGAETTKEKGKGFSPTSTDFKERLKADKDAVEMQAVKTSPALPTPTAPEPEVDTPKPG